MGSSSDSSSNQNNSTEKEIDSIKFIDVVIKRISYTFIGCIIVLAILFLIIISIVPNDKINIAFSFNDAFIGVIATLIGIMVTFVIGYQILNAIQIKDEIVAQNNRIDSFNSKIESMNTNIENVKGNSNINTQKIINLENITNKYILKIEEVDTDKAYFNLWQSQLNMYLGDKSQNSDFRFSLYLSMIIELAQSNLNSYQFSRYFAELLKLRFLLIETLKEFVLSKEYNETSRKEKINKINKINNLIQSKSHYSELTEFINNIHQYIITMDDNYLSQIEQMNSIN